MADTREPTPEEIEQIKIERTTYWESMIPFLTKQAEYERLVTELEELHMRKIFAQVKVANMVADPPQPEGEPKMRALKKEQPGA